MAHIAEGKGDSFVQPVNSLAAARAINKDTPRKKRSAQPKKRPESKHGSQSHVLDEYA